jgi:hypothetical protein
VGVLASDVVAGIVMLILVFLVLTNFKGLTEIMKQGGTTVSQVSKTLQGR